MLKKATFCAIVLGFLCASAFAQLWPLPDYTKQNTQVPCANCLDAAKGMPTPGYSDPVARFVGRFMSSEYVADFQTPIRTLRAGGLRFTPDGSRMGVKLGNAVATYDTAQFITRLENHEPMVSVSTIVNVDPAARFYGPMEIFLNFDRYFYAENGRSNWLIAAADGQDRLSDFDMDDRGMVYIAYSMFGWGVATDIDPTNNRLMNSWQDVNSFKDNKTTGTKAWAPVTTAFWVKDGADYYALAQSATSQKITHVFKVPTYSTVTEMPYSLPQPVRMVSRGANNRTAVAFGSTDHNLYIYDNHALVTNGLPAATVPFGASTIAGITFDGTNWWVSSFDASLKASFTRITPGGVATEYKTNYGQAVSLKYNGGYLALVTIDPSATNVHLYNVSGASPVEIQVPSIGNYFKNQAGFAPLATHMQLYSVDPLVKNGKLYLIVSADGIGDVYEIRTADTVNVSVLGTVGPWNGNAPLKATGDVFYGDTVKFSAVLSSGGAAALNWDFGATHDPANTAPGSANATMTHQYTGLSPADIASPLTVKATNTGNGIFGTYPLTLKQGTARLKFGNSTAKTLVTLPGTGAPIVTDDSFYDASDGDTSGHYTEWRIGADAAAIAIPGFVPQYLDPTTAVPVGACGQHTLSMTAHYGYTAPGVSNVEFASPLGNFTYTVSPFATALDVRYNATTGNEEFFNTSRAAALLSGRTFTYNWEVVNNATDAAITTIPAKSGTVTSIDQIPVYPVSKTLFPTTGDVSYAGRLTLSVSGVDPCSQTGATMATQQKKSSALIAPDAQLTAACPNGGGTCNFSISSPSGVMQSDAWTFAWTATSGTPSSGTQSTFSSSYFAVGDYPVTVTVTNKTGLSKQIPYTAHITNPASQCPTFSASNVGITFSGTNTSTSCVDGGNSTCLAGEPIQFSLTFYPSIPPQSCLDSIGYAWKVDGGTTQNGSTVSTSFGSTGQHSVTLTLTAPVGQTLPLSKTINIGTTPTPFPIPPTPPTPPTSNPACGTMSAVTTYIQYTGNSAGCNSTGGACAAGESINFGVYFFSYNNLCATHTYTWSFDGGPGTAGPQQLAHSFSTTGQHTIACTVNNGSASFTANAVVNITGGTTPPTPTTPNPPTGCGTLTANQTVFLDYVGTTPACRTNGPCTAGELVNLLITFYGGYNEECATHTFTWKVDGVTVGTSKTATATLTAGNHTIVCTVSNGSQSIDLTQPVVVTGSNPATPQYTFDFKATALPFPANSWAFTLTADPAAVAPTTWVWNFGDNSGEVTGSAIQTHTYQNSNDYTITVHALGSTEVKSHKLSDLTEPPPVTRRRGVRH